MPAYEPDAWHEFFIGSAGGVAALSGLIFVAVSVNPREIFAAEKSGLSIIVRAGGGLYRLPAAFVIAIAVAAINAWVLLVEVLR